MVGVWTYPWTLYQEGVDEACERLVSKGLDKIAVASHHHSARILQPRFPDALFERRPAGCYFTPKSTNFENTPLFPIENEIEGAKDPLAEIVEIGAEHELQVNAWMVCLHNSRLGARYPAFRIQDAFGSGHDHALCPSHPEVREYFAGVTAELVDRDVDAVEVESVGYPLAFHGHGSDFGHDARQVISSESGQRLFSQCFCTSCRREAAEYGLDIDEAAERVRELCRPELTDPDAQPLPLAALVREEPVLHRLFDFRARIIEKLLEAIACAAGDATVNVYVRRNDPNWPAGRTMTGLETYADRLTVLCYVSEPEDATKLLRRVTSRVDVPVDAGVTLDPSVVDTAADFTALVDAIRTSMDGRVTVYNHAMMTDAHLEWIEHATTSG